MGQFAITLQGIELYGYHGLYSGEKELGAKYRIDLKFELSISEKQEIKISETVDYKKAYDIVSEIFKTPTPLLENICTKIANELKKVFTNTETILVSVSKLSPPLGGITEAAKVEYLLK
jgi:7,8-dihydroneopterin aldolase/epimerase/oxygenase